MVCVGKAAWVEADLGGADGSQFSCAQAAQQGEKVNSTCRDARRIRQARANEESNYESDKQNSNGLSW